MQKCFDRSGGPIRIFLNPAGNFTGSHRFARPDFMHYPPFGIRNTWTDLWHFTLLAKGNENELAQMN
jgi:hypothetical protein